MTSLRQVNLCQNTVAPRPTCLAGQKKKMIEPSRKEISTILEKRELSGNQGNPYRKKNVYIFIFVCLSVCLFVHTGAAELIIITLLTAFTCENHWLIQYWLQCLVEPGRLGSHCLVEAGGLVDSGCWTPHPSTAVAVGRWGDGGSGPQHYRSGRPSLSDQ